MRPKDPRTIGESLERNRLVDLWRGGGGGRRGGGGRKKREEKKQRGRTEPLAVVSDNCSG